MLLTDYFRSKKDATWDYAIQSGVKHGVIRLPEDDDFDLTNKSHWKTVYDRFTNFGITPVIIEPMPNCVHDHIKAGDSLRDEVRIVFKKALTDREQKVFDYFATSNQNDIIDRSTTSISILFLFSNFFVRSNN